MKVVVKTSSPERDLLLTRTLLEDICTLPESRSGEVILVVRVSDHQVLRSSTLGVHPWSAICFPEPFPT